jgi:hypothetical protein
VSKLGKAFDPLNFKTTPMKFKFSALVILLVSLGVIWSCGGKKGGKDSTKFGDAGDLPKEIKKVVYNIPRPSEIPYMLQGTGAEFNQSLINDRRKSESYSEQNKQALNLGVYTSDIAYLSSYEKTQQCIDYLTACRSLADKLGITGSFDPKLIEDFEKNIGNKDVLAALIDTTARKADLYLKDANRSEMGALLVTGAFVEGLYIATGIIKTYPKNLLAEDQKNLVLTPLMKVIINQKESVSEVTKMLAAVNQTGSVPAILSDMQALETSYKALNINDQITKQKAHLALSDKNLEEITRLVEKLRGDIVQ